MPKIGILSPNLTPLFVTVPTNKIPVVAGIYYEPLNLKRTHCVKQSATSYRIRAVVIGDTYNPTKYG